MDAYEGIDVMLSNGWVGSADGEHARTQTWFELCVANDHDEVRGRDMIAAE